VSDHDYHEFNPSERTPGSTLVPTESAESGAYDPRPQTRPARSYIEFERAFEVLNREFFDGHLPPCLITMQRAGRAHGYFSGDRFINIEDPRERADEIAMNPIHFSTQLTAKTLATFAHEMVHLWQHHFGTPSRAGYHNKQWAQKMREIGLVPSSTGAPGGKDLGETVSHYIESGGRFEIFCTAYLANNSITLFQDAAYREVRIDVEAETSDGKRQERAVRIERAYRERERKAASKTRFTCPRCKQNAWASRKARLLCGGDACDGEGMVP
jgi:hypothetical protein